MIVFKTLFLRNIYRYYYYSNGKTNRQQMLVQSYPRSVTSSRVASVGSRLCIFFTGLELARNSYQSYWAKRHDLWNSNSINPFCALLNYKESRVPICLFKRLGPTACWVEDEKARPTEFFPVGVINRLDVINWHGESGYWIFPSLLIHCPTRSGAFCAVLFKRKF